MSLIAGIPLFLITRCELRIRRRRVKEPQKMAPQMNIKIQPPYFDAPDYIAALVASAKNHLAGGYDHLLFSFHGIPERHLHKSDPTGCHCLKRKIVARCPSPAHSDLLPRAMLQNSCGLRRPGGCASGKIFRFVPIPARQGPVAEALHGFGTRKISRARHQKTAGHLPGLCLGLSGNDRRNRDARTRKRFWTAGGDELTLVPCMNEHPRWLDALEKMIGRV